MLRAFGGLSKNNSRGKHLSIDALTSTAGSCPAYFSFSRIATQKFAKKTKYIRPTGEVMENLAHALKKG
jgi:hypothetical protein